MILDVEEKVEEKEKLHLEIPEKDVRGGFQNIGNMGRFLKAAQIMGTRRLPPINQLWKTSAYDCLKNCIWIFPLPQD